LRIRFYLRRQRESRNDWRSLQAAQQARLVEEAVRWAFEALLHFLLAFFPSNAML
jgi:hypothetical protein